MRGRNAAASNPKSLHISQSSRPDKETLGEMSAKETMATNETAQSEVAAKKEEETNVPVAASFVSCSAPTGNAAPRTLAGVEDSVNALLGHGPYQRRMLVCGILGIVTGLLQYMSYRLIGRPVDHWCRPPVELGDLSAAAWKNLSIPVEADGSFSMCTMFDPTMEDTSPQNRTVVSCLDWDYDISEKGDSIVSRYDLVCSREFLYRLSMVLTSLGYITLSPVAGFASDRVGRKPVALLVAFVMVLSVIGCSVARTFTFFLFNRVLAMASANGGYLLTFILLYEGTGPALRWRFLMLHTALVGTLVPPIVHIISMLQPRWVLAHGLLISPAAGYVAWCSLLEESPAWLLATGRLREAEEGVLLAARINGQDVDKARRDFRVPLGELEKLKDNLDLTPLSSASEGILETMRVAAFFARFTLSGVYFGLVVSEKTSGFFWQAVFIAMSTTVYASVVWAMSRRGTRDTLSVALVVTCYSALVKSLLMLSGNNDVTPFVHAGMKAVTSGSMSVVMCYAGDAFPTYVRSVGVSLSVLFGGMGSFVGIFLTKVKSEPDGILFYMYAALMTMLSILAVQWLPEVFIQKTKTSSPKNAMTAEERKVALKASLMPTEAKQLQKRREGKMKVLH